MTPTLLVQVAAAVSIPIIAALSSHCWSVHPVLTAVLVTVIWLSSTGHLSAAMLLLPITMIAIVTALFLKSRSLTIDAMIDLIFRGQRVVDSPVLELLAYFYYPIVTVGIALRAKTIIPDLARYSLWRLRQVREAMSWFMVVGAFIDVATVTYLKVEQGLKTHYVFLDKWTSRMRYVGMWAPIVLRSLLITALARAQYLAITRIRLSALRINVKRGITWTERIAIAWVLFSTVLLITSAVSRPFVSSSF